MVPGSAIRMEKSLPDFFRKAADGITLTRQDECWRAPAGARWTAPGTGRRAAARGLWDGSGRTAPTGITSMTGASMQTGWQQASAAPGIIPGRKRPDADRLAADRRRLVLPGQDAERCGRAGSGSEAPGTTWTEARARMRTGWQRIGGYLVLSGRQRARMRTGWQYVGNAWYYLNGSGAMQTGWQQIGGAWYYLSGSGAMLTGWQQIGGVWYYLDGSGRMLTGWQRIGNVWYYLSGSGAMLTGWQRIGGVWYYLDGSGRMLTGWQQIGGVWYYLDGTGAMQTGWQRIGGTWYYLNGSGSDADRLAADRRDPGIIWTPPAPWPAIPGSMATMSTEAASWDSGGSSSPPRRRA